MSRPGVSLNSPLEFVRLAGQYPLRWLVPAILITAIGSAVAMLRHDSWEASQALMVRDEAGVATPLDRPGKFQHAEEMKSAQETILELAKNRSVLSEALKEVGPAPGADVETWPTPRVIAQLESNLKITPPKGADFGKTEIFYLKVQDRDRDRASQLVEAISNQVQHRFQDLRGARAQSMIDELSRTVALAHKDLEDSTHKLTAIETSVGSDLAELRILQEAPAGDSQMRRTNIEIENELRQVRTSQQSNQELLALLKRAQDNPSELMDAPSRLLEIVRLGVGYGAAAVDDAHLLEELIFLHRARGRVDRVIGIALLRRSRHRHRHDKHERQRADDETSVRKQSRHATSSLFLCPLENRTALRSFRNAARRSLRSRWSLCKPSSNPKRRSCSRAGPRAPCRSGR